MESGNDRPINWRLLTRYVAGTCSGEERVIAEAWAAADPRNRRLLEGLQRAWAAADQDEGGAARAPSVDVDAAWGALQRRVRAAEGEKARGEKNVSEPARPARPSRAARPAAPRRTLHAGVVAAGVLGVVTVALIVFAFGGLSSTVEAATGEKVFTAQRGQRAVVELTDGTQVRLNAESQLRLSEDGFSGGQRRVWLNGEAYFEVARDTTRPFLVQAKGKTVRVLGTAFNVQAYGGDAAPMQVAVAEGEVALQEAGEATAPGGGPRLLPKQVGTAEAGGGWQVRRNVDLSAQLAWTEGRLAFEEAPFDEVVRKLERWYDLRIEVRLPPGAIDRLSAHFDNEPLQQILSDISVALRLHYKRTRDTVVFYRPDGPSGGSPGRTGQAWPRVTR